MTETEFIELTLRYLDGAASQSQVDQLGASMLDHPERRAIYRGLAQQAQLAHEWQATTPVPAAAARRPITKLALATAAAAALILASVFLSGAFSDKKPPVTVESPPDEPGLQLPPYFDDRDPSWADIYGSLFDYPEFVWRFEIPAESGGSEKIDVFSDSGDPPLLLAVTPEQQFRQLLAPIFFVSSGDRFRQPALY